MDAIKHNYVTVTEDSTDDEISADEWNAYHSLVLALNVIGNIIGASNTNPTGSTMKLKRTAGRILRSGAGYDQHQFRPDVFITEDSDPLPFYRVYRDSGSWYINPALSYDVDPNNYDNGIDLTPVPSAGTEWVVDDSNVTCDWAGDSWLTDTSKAWTPNEWAGYYVRIGSGTYDEVEITGNSETVLWFAGNTVTGLQAYEIGHYVAGNESYTIQTIFQPAIQDLAPNPTWPEDYLVIQYGQTVYGSMAEALASVYDGIGIHPMFRNGFVLRGWLILKRNCTNILDNEEEAVFVSADDYDLLSILGLNTDNSPTFSNLTLTSLILGSLSGMLKATAGLISQATAGQDFENVASLYSQQNRFYMWTHFLGQAEEMTNYTAGTGADFGGEYSEDDQPGIMSVETGTDADGRAGIYFLSYYAIRPGAWEWTFEAYAKVPILADATDDFLVRIGFWRTNWVINSAATDIYNGACFEYDRTQDTTYWVTVTGVDSTYTRNVSSVAVAENTWTKFKVVINSDCTSVAFYINDVLVATHTTNLPLDKGINMGMGIHKVAGSNNRQLWFDWMNVRGNC